MSYDNHIILYHTIHLYPYDIMSYELEVSRD